MALAPVKGGTSLRITIFKSIQKLTDVKLNIEVMQDTVQKLLFFDGVIFPKIWVTEDYVKYSI